MFDTFLPRSRDVYITEKRAPTDESVRLLREMEAKAAERIVDAVRLENTIVDAVVHVERDVLSDQIRHRIVYKIQGDRRTVDYVCDASSGDKYQRIRELTQALANDIAVAMMGDMLLHVEKFKEL